MLNLKIIFFIFFEMLYIKKIKDSNLKTLNVLARCIVNMRLGKKLLNVKSSTLKLKEFEDFEDLKDFNTLITKYGIKYEATSIPRIKVIILGESQFYHEEDIYKELEKITKLIKDTYPNDIKISVPFNQNISGTNNYTLATYNTFVIHLLRKLIDNCELEVVKVDDIEISAIQGYIGETFGTILLDSYNVFDIEHITFMMDPPINEELHIYKNLLDWPITLNRNHSNMFEMFANTIPPIVNLTVETLRTSPINFDNLKTSGVAQLNNILDKLTAQILHVKISQIDYEDICDDLKAFPEPNVLLNTGNDQLYVYYICGIANMIFSGKSEKEIINSNVIKQANSENTKKKNQTIGNIYQLDKKPLGIQKSTTPQKKHQTIKVETILSFNEKVREKYRRELDKISEDEKMSKLFEEDIDSEINGKICEGYGIPMTETTRYKAKAAWKMIDPNICGLCRLLCCGNSYVLCVKSAYYAFCPICFPIIWSCAHHIPVSKSYMKSNVIPLPYWFKLEKIADEIKEATNVFITTFPNPLTSRIKMFTDHFVDEANRNLFRKTLKLFISKEENEIKTNTNGIRIFEFDKKILIYVDVQHNATYKDISYISNIMESMEKPFIVCSPILGTIFKKHNMIGIFANSENEFTPTIS
jgi:hypothetical protein